MSSRRPAPSSSALFGLVDCVYETGAAESSLPRLGIHGAIEGAPLVATHTDFLLPPGGVEIAVAGRGTEFGRLVMFASESVRAPLQKRVVAVAIAGSSSASRSRRRELSRLTPR